VPSAKDLQTVSMSASDEPAVGGAQHGDAVTAAAAAVAATAAVESRPSTIYFDGKSNRKRSVTLRFADGLDILEQDSVVATWPYDAVRRADGPPEVLRLSCVAALPLARLEVHDAAARELVTTHCKSLDLGRGLETQAWRIVALSLAAVTSIALIVYYGIPIVAERLAPLVPAVIEDRIGEAVDQQVRAMFGSKLCSNAEGQAAFTSLVDKLRRAGGIEDRLDARVLSSSLPNAFALPGRKVYLLNGLLEKARSVDEVAGVLAHELGHVYYHHNMRKIIQNGGTSFLIGLLFGDITGSSAVIFAGQSLLDASYSRDAERDADGFAIDLMHKLGRSPKPLGEFLVRLTGREANTTISIFSSHPLTEARLARISGAARPSTGPEILSAAEWRALKAICQTPNR